MLASAIRWVSSFFLKAPPSPFAAATISSGYILLDGGRNFRDLGGYRTADGHVVRGEFLYRSGSLANLTPAGRAAFEHLNVGTIFDLRANEERAHDPDNWQQTPNRLHWTRDYKMADMVAMMKIFADPANSQPTAVKAITGEAYLHMTVEQAPAYRALFARLMAPHKGAIVVNCTAGKDRTGVASALVLTALGVPYATVKQDYLLSNNAPGMNTLARDLLPLMAGLPPERAAQLAGVDGYYLDAAYAGLAKDYGSVEGFMAKELGMGPKQIKLLRQRMLQ